MEEWKEKVTFNELIRQLIYTQCDHVVQYLWIGSDRIHNPLSLLCDSHVQISNVFKIFVLKFIACCWNVDEMTLLCEYITCALLLMCCDSQKWECP